MAALGEGFEVSLAHGQNLKVARYNAWNHGRVSFETGFDDLQLLQINCADLLRFFRCYGTGWAGSQLLEPASSQFAHRQTPGHLCHPKRFPDKPLLTLLRPAPDSDFGLLRSVGRSQFVVESRTLVIHRQLTRRQLENGSPGDLCAASYNQPYVMASTFALPPEIWSAIVDFLSFREASRGRVICKAFDEAVGKLKHLDLSECNSLLNTKLMLCKATTTGTRKLTVPMIRFLEDFQLLERFYTVHMTGSGVPLENMLTKIPRVLGYTGLSHLTLTNAAFVKYAQHPNSTCEYYFTFDVSALAYASKLQSFHAHFDRIVSHISRYDCCCGAWLSGMEHCQARDVRIVVESPPFKSITDDGPSYGAGGGLGDRMSFNVRIPSRVHHLYILTDCVLWLDRPAGNKYTRGLSSDYSGQYIDEGDPQEVFNMCLLSVKRPSLDLPNTQIRRLHPCHSAAFQRPLICVTSKSTPDHIYASNLSRLVPGHSDISLADEISSDSWDDE